MGHVGGSLRKWIPVLKYMEVCVMMRETNRSLNRIICCGYEFATCETGCKERGDVCRMDWDKQFIESQKCVMWWWERPICLSWVGIGGEYCRLGTLLTMGACFKTKSSSVSQWLCQSTRLPQATVVVRINHLTKREYHLVLFYCIRAVAWKLHLGYSVLRYVKRELEPKQGRTLSTRHTRFPSCYG